MRRPEWARRDWRPVVIATTAGAAGGACLALFVTVIVLTAQGVL